MNFGYAQKNFLNNIQERHETNGAPHKRPLMFKWTFRILSSLNMSIRTKELVLFLLDYLMTRPVFEDMRLELLSISVVYYLMKLEGDIPPTIAEFNIFVEKKLQISKFEIFEIELKILVELPEHFLTMLTFSDIVGLVIGDSSPEIQMNKKLLRRSIRLCLNYYIVEANGFLVQDISYAAIIVTANNLIITQKEKWIRDLRKTKLYIDLEVDEEEVARLIEALDDFPKTGLGFANKEIDSNDSDVSDEEH
jgi:hypothetical protein